MSAITPIQYEHEKAIVRRVLTFNPSISINQLQKLLESSGENRIVREVHYLGRLVRDIRADRTREVQEKTKIDLYSEMADIVEYVNNQLRAIANEEKLVYTKVDKDGKPDASPETRIFAQNNRIKALVEVVKNVERLFNMKMDLGIIERNLGRADVRILELLAFIDNERNGSTDSSSVSDAGLQIADGVSVGNETPA
jgi:hypothetical protein